MIQRGENELATHGFFWEEGLHFPLTKKETRALVAIALEEDDTKHDITTAATVLSDRRARCRLVSRESGVVSGLPLAYEAFEQLDRAVTIRIEHEDASRVEPQTPVMFLSGHARGILSAERVALNFAQRLSGIATMTARYVDAIAGTGAHILDTRKTTPLFRRLEKYAVRCGGGLNHRMDLSSSVLIKDNHLATVDGDIALAVERARGLAPAGMKVEVECETLDHVRAAGIAVCCGGIVGMGEGREDRVGMIVALATLPQHPESVPINMLVQVEGTPLATGSAFDPIEFVRTIAVARICMPASVVRLSAGREDMSEETQALCFLAGANSIFYGPKLLTTPNPGRDRDMQLLDKLGMQPMR